MNKIDQRPIDLLLSRRSTLARNMLGPGPDRAEVERMLRVATRVPDHGKLTPWRFLVFQGESRQRLGAAIVDCLKREDPTRSEELLERLQQFPTLAPTLIVVVSKPQLDSKIPLWEQHLSAGAACQNLLLAAISLGFAAQWLTGAAAYSPGVHDHLDLEEADKIAGFVFIGSASEKPLSERPRPELVDVVDWC